ncbi:hypothetical protein EJB05_12312, partial [Eragrostis curvula]
MTLELCLGLGRTQRRWRRGEGLYGCSVLVHPMIDLLEGKFLLVSAIPLMGLNLKLDYGEKVQKLSYEAPMYQ